MFQDFATDFKSVFLRYVHSWFIRSLFWPSTQCISTTTSPSSSITFNRHLKRNCFTARGLGAGSVGSLAADAGAFSGSAPCAASVDTEDSMSPSASDAFSGTSSCSPLEVCVPPSLGSWEEEPFPGPSGGSWPELVLFSKPSSWGCVTAGPAGLTEVWVLLPGQGGALGSSRSWRIRSRLFCRPWIQVFSTAVRKRLCSWVLQGTCLCRTCRVTEMGGGSCMLFKMFPLY